MKKNTLEFARSTIQFLNLFRLQNFKIHFDSFNESNADCISTACISTVSTLHYLCCFSLLFQSPYDRVNRLFSPFVPFHL